MLSIPSTVTDKAVHIFPQKVMINSHTQSRFRSNLQYKDFAMAVILIINTSIQKTAYTALSLFPLQLVKIRFIHKFIWVPILILFFKCKSTVENEFY